MRIDSAPSRLPESGYRSAKDAVHRTLSRALRIGLVSATILAGMIPSWSRCARAQQSSPLPFPRLANMYWRADVDSTVIASLARWDVVVLNSIWTNAQLEQLRQLNPNIKIFFYVIAYTVELPPASGDPWKLENYQYAAANDLWWYDKYGAIASDWPNTQMCNVTALGPSGPSGTWSEYIAARIEALVAAHPDLDGVFLDNFWEQISWQQAHRQLDSDCNPTYNPAGCDGVADSNTHLDSLWNDALRGVAADLRTRFDILQAGRARPLTLIANNAADYFDFLNGAMVEYFPSGHSNVDYDNLYGYNWNQEMIAAPGGYLVTPFRAAPYQVQVLNADWSGTVWEPFRGLNFERHKRFTFVSALLGDGYYSFDAGQTTGHGNLWWEPEYDHAGRGKGYLGQPLGPMVRLLQPTGPELLQNGDFSVGTSGWFGFPFSATGSMALDSTTFHSGPTALRIDVASVSPGGHYKLWQSNISLVHHQPYTLSFWARAAGPRSITIHVYSDSCPSYRCWNDREFFLGTDWTRYEISFASTGTAVAGLNLFVDEPGSVWLDDLSLRTGDTSLFRREFEGGIVLLNYTNQNQTVDLGGTFYRPRIPGNTVFDGASVTQEIVPPSDARIVLRDSTPAPGDTSTVSDVPPADRARNALWQNEPNPFNPTTEIRFTLERDEPATLAIYDVAGRRVRTLLDRAAASTGTVHRVGWDGRDDRGYPLSSGVYVYRLSTPSFAQSRKMVLLR